MSVAQYTGVGVLTGIGVSEQRGEREDDLEEREGGGDCYSVSFVRTRCKFFLPVHGEENERRQLPDIAAVSKSSDPHESIEWQTL